MNSNSMSSSAELDNRISLESREGVTWVTELNYASPLRIFEVGRSKKNRPARLVLSNHGGGMLQGDVVSLEVKAGAGSRSELRSQANTQILNNPSGKHSIFNLDARMQEGATHNFLCEPVVMHAHALYVQEQNWEMEKGSRLVLTDWFQSGRSESGEQFKFTSYTSRLHIRYNGKTVIRERFAVNPGLSDVGSPAAFCGYDHMVNAYIVGDYPPELYDAVPESGNFQNIRNRPLQDGSAFNPALSGGRQVAAWFSSARVRGGLVIRALGRKRSDLEAKLMDLITPFIDWQ